jgi:nucleoside-diphosphate-sugar epimerase
MVIGNGLLAKKFNTFEKDDRFLIFAAGVSNSRTRDEKEFKREAALLKTNLEEHPQKIPVYFSTYSIYDPDQEDTVYVRHKLNMERLVKEHASRYFIFRVSNLAGNPGNPNTVLNYFYYHIQNQFEFDLWVNACRNILDIDDLYFITLHLLESNEEYRVPINIANPVNYPVTQIVNALESYLGLKANYKTIDKGSCFDIDLKDIKHILDQMKGFDDNYLNRVIEKYFPKP